MIPSISDKKMVLDRLGDFFTWWGSELAGLLPAFIKRFFQVDSYRIYLNLASGKITLVDFLKNEILEEIEIEEYAEVIPDSFKAAITRLNTSRIETQLILGSQDGLFLNIDLPAAAESNLHNILGYEMDRQTPFKIDQVYYDYEIKKSPRNAERILVKLVVVPRDLVKHWIDWMHNWGWRPEVVTVAEKNADNSFTETPVNLLPSELRSSKPQGIARINYVLIVSALGIMIMMAWFVIDRQENYINELKQEIESVSSNVREVQALRKQIDQFVSEYTDIVKRKQQSISVIDILNDLTILMPDHTWLQRLEVNGSRVKLQGESTNTSDLIGLIEASEKFQNVKFTSPVVRDDKSGRDRFQILANIVSQGNES